jgi:hypothetical protein
MTQVIDRWYQGHVDADDGDHEWYLENKTCSCCNVYFGYGDCE